MCLPRMMRLPGPLPVSITIKSLGGFSPLNFQSMKYVIAALFCLGAFAAKAQSVYPIRADTVKIYKVGGFAELVLQNRTKDSIGLLINLGNGKTEFRRAKKLDSSHIIIGLDTLEVGTAATDSSIFATIYRQDTALQRVYDSIRAHNFTVDSIPNANSVTRGLLYPDLYFYYSGKVDSITISNDSVFQYRDGFDKYFAFKLPASSGTDSSIFVTVTRLADSTAALRSLIGSGGGTISGSIASGQVGYGSASNTIAGESAFSYNSSTNTLVSDTASHLQVIANGAVQHPLQVKPNYGGYAGIVIDNQSSSNSAANRIYLASGSGAYKDSGLQIYQLPQGFSGGWNYGVVREVGSGGLIIASNNAPMYFETGTPGVDNAYLGAAFNTSKNWIIGPDIGAGDLTDIHGVRLMVNGALKARDSVVFCDNGGGFANVYAGHYRDQGYLQDVGFQFYNRNATSSFIAFRINPNASLFSNYYKTSATTTGYTRLAVAFDGSGNMQQKQIFDSTSGTANPDQILYYEGAPTSSANFKYSPTNKTFTINYGSGGTIFADSLRLYKGYLMLNDEGHNYTFIKALNYLNNASYVEGVGIKFQTIKQGNSAVDAFRIDSAGEIKIPQSPKSAASTDSVLFRAGSDGSVHQTTIARLATLMGLSSGISRIAPLDSLAKDAKGAQVSGVSFVPQTADDTYPGLVSVDDQTFAGVKTFLASPVVPTPSPNDNSTNAASTAYVDAAVSSAVGASGKYLPTITDVSNAGSITSDTALWIRNGDNVFVDGKFDVTPTSGSVLTGVDIVLPVNSALLGGHACWGSGMTSQTVNGGVGCVIATSAPNKARLSLYATGQTTSLTVYYHLQYNVQ